VTALEHDSSAPTTPDADALEIYRRMVRIRLFEETAAELYRDGAIPGFLHVSTGQEATAVGACWSLRQTDGIVSTHRGHGHCLAKGAEPGPMFAELMGKSTGTCRGYGGSMHIADISKGIFGANGIVGAGLPIAAGIAQAMRLRGTDDVVVAFFGDGAVATGAFHEAVNLAALRRLPILFLCENNHYAEFSAAESQHLVPVHQRAAAYGIEGSTVDGNDVLEVCAVASDLIARLRAGERPHLLEAVTYRRHGHYEGDPGRYRSEAELAEWQARDPLANLEAEFALRNLTEKASAVLEEVRAEITQAVAFAYDSPEPEVEPKTYEQSRLSEADRYWASHALDELGGDEVFRTMDAVKEAIDKEMSDGDDVWLAGIDVGPGGNIYGVTRGLWQKFDGRVIDTPISETAIAGLAVGGAMAGTRPIVEIMYCDFIGVCLDQIMNQAAKLPFMTGGAATMSLVIRTQIGAGRSSAAQHSQSLEAMLAHIPGLVVVMPSTPAETYGLLRSAIADPRPVVFIEHRFLYGKKGPRPPADSLVPIGVAAVRRPGRDVTVISWSKSVDRCLAAAEIAAERGVDAEVIDLRTVSPIDQQTIVASVTKTGRLVVVHEAVVSGGLGAEIAARVADECFWHLDAPVRRVGAPFSPAPYAPSLERDYVPDEERILDEILSVART
jgi:2-oxoisovalerate dehydrogenase E1 component